MAWIKVDETLPDHPKVIKLADALKMDKDLAAGKLVRFWTWALNNRDNGVLARHDAETIAEAMRFKGKASRLIQALVDAALLDETPDGWKIHDWTDYSGNYVEKRSAAVERKQKERQRKRDERVTSATNKEETPSDNGVTSEGQACDIGVTPAPQQRDESVTVTLLDKDRDRDREIEYDNGGNRAGARTCTHTREETAEVGNPISAPCFPDMGNPRTGLPPAMRDKRYAALIDTYTQNIRMPSPIEAESISRWLGDMPADVIDYAIKQAALSGIRSWRGVETILLRWQSVGVRDLPGAQAAQREWANRGQVTQQRASPSPRPQGTLGRTMSNLDALMAQTLEEERDGHDYQG